MPEARCSVNLAAPLTFGVKVSPAIRILSGRSPSAATAVVLVE
ncbi:hypothetical protein ACFPRL_32400 [Pseudoclavibacter helvolus]